MPTLITTHPRTADLGKPHIFIIGGDTSGLGYNKALKVSKTQRVRAYQYIYQPPAHPVSVAGSQSNAIAFALDKSLETVIDFVYHLVEAAPRLAKGIATLGVRKTWKYIRQTGVHVYLIANAISGKTQRSSRDSDHSQTTAIGINHNVTDADTLKLHNLTTGLVWMFILLSSIIGFQTKLFVLSCGPMSSFPHDKSNRLNHRAS